jgi:hypothetical protein
VATPTGGPTTPSAAVLTSTDEPIHIINVAIKNGSSSSDEELVKKCYTFVQVLLVKYMYMYNVHACIGIVMEI